MKLVVIGIGKLRDAAIVGLCDEYVKRSRKFVPIEHSHVGSTEGLWRKAEGGKDKMVLVDERGEQVDSAGLARRVERWRDAAVRRVVFAIGGSDGFTDSDRQRADALLGLSKLTLPHRLAHLVLCEQLYRAGTILSGHPYHHD